jgi:aminocarboxymuconate-semialdehyde decarboxylase
MQPATPAVLVLDFIFFHLLQGMPSESATAICCLIFGGVLESFPKLKFCFAHGGTVFLLHFV